MAMFAGYMLLAIGIAGMTGSWWMYGLLLIIVGAGFIAAEAHYRHKAALREVLREVLREIARGRW